MKIAEEKNRKMTVHNFLQVDEKSKSIEKKKLLQKVKIKIKKMWVTTNDKKLSDGRPCLGNIKRRKKNEKRKCVYGGDEHYIVIL